MSQIQSNEDWVQMDEDQIFTVLVVPEGYEFDRYSYWSDSRLAGGGVVKEAGGVIRVVAKKR